MAIQASTLRPGLLVSLRTSIQGNVKYDKIDLEEDHVTEDGQRKARWETVRTIEDPEEHERAHKARDRVKLLVRSACVFSEFGLLCPDGKTGVLDEQIKEARRVADEFNATSTISKVRVYVLVGRIAPDDAEAVKAISSEIRELLSTMETGISNLDVKSVRAAADRAKNLGTMLSPDAQERVLEAVEAARAVARKIVKAGEQAAQEIDRTTIARIAAARTMFLDIDTVPTEIGTAESVGRAVDLAPEVPEEVPTQDQVKHESSVLDLEPVADIGATVAPQTRNVEF